MCAVSVVSVIFIKFFLECIYPIYYHILPFICIFLNFLKKIDTTDTRPYKHCGSKLKAVPILLLWQTQGRHSGHKTGHNWTSTWFCDSGCVYSVPYCALVVSIFENVMDTHLVTYYTIISVVLYALLRIIKA